MTASSRDPSERASRTVSGGTAGSSGPPGRGAGGPASPNDGRGRDRLDRSGGTDRSGRSGGADRPGGSDRSDRSDVHRVEREARKAGGTGREHGAEQEDDGAPTELMPDIASILADSVGLARQRDEYLNALQSLKADFDNYRKRVVRQQEDQSARAAADLVKKLLPVCDTLDLAIEHLGPSGDDAPSPETQALVQARSMLMDVLSREGLERVDEENVVFDPVVHDAVAHSPSPATAGGPDTPDHGGTPGSLASDGRDGDHEEDDGGEGATHAPTMVDEVLRSGYRWRGNVLRPAMVRVRG